MGISNEKAIRYHWEVLDDYSATTNNNINHTGLCEKDLATNVLLEPGNTNVIPSVCRYKLFPGIAKKQWKSMI